MKFFKITKELDQKRIDKIGFLVGGELLTVKEAKRYNILDLLTKKAEIINVSKFKTHYFFGTRRINTINI